MELQERHVGKKKKEVLTKEPSYTSGQQQTPDSLVFLKSVSIKWKELTDARSSFASLQPKWLEYSEQTREAATLWLRLCTKNKRSSN